MSRKQFSISWTKYMLRYRARYGLALCALVAVIPFSLITAVLSGFAVKQLLSKPAFLPWENLLGSVIATQMRVYFQNTPFAQGLSVEAQSQFVPWLLIVVAALTAFFKFIQDYLLEDVGERIAKDLRDEVTQGFLSLDYVSARRVREGLLASFVGEDSREIRLAFTSVAGQIPANALQAVVFLTWLLFLDFKLFFLFSAVLIPAGVVIRFTGKTLRKLSRQGIDLQTDLLGTLLEKLRGWQTIRVYDAIPYEITRFDEFNSRLFHAWRRVARVRAFGGPVVEWLAMIAAAMIAVVALRRIAEQEMTGDIFAIFLTTVAVLANALQVMTSLMNGSKKGVEAFRRVGEFLNFCRAHAHPESVSQMPQNSRIECVQLNNLAVAHPETRGVLASNINVTLKRGDTCVVVGPSGTGKSTLFRVLLGLETPASGSVLVNNIVPSEIDFAAWSGRVAFLPQEPFVFDATVLENVVYPRASTTLTETELARASEALNRANLQKLPTDTVKGFSGGEKQRLAFARAFFSEPDLLLIDEGTSALDMDNEKSILETLKHDSSNRISIIIAHRPMAREFASHLLNLSSAAG